MNLPSCHRSGFLPALLSVLVLPAVLAAQATVVPTDIQMPGTQPLDINDLESPDSCGVCHGNYDDAVEPYRNWRGSMMSQATRDPVFWAALAVAEQDFTGAGDLCLRCHTPQGWIAGRSTPTDGSALLDGDAHGVTCDACHRAVKPDNSEWFGAQFAPFVANDGGSPPEAYIGAGQYVHSMTETPKFGPYSDAVTPHGFQQTSFIRSSEMCGTCHDVSNPLVGDLAPNNGASTPLAPGTFDGDAGDPVDGKAAFNNFPHQYGVVERTFSEHFSSSLSTLPVSDYGTLPAELQDGAIEDAFDAAVAADPSGNYVDGTVRVFSCQTCHMPPVTGKGCALDGPPVRSDLPLHDLTGGNTFAPQAIQYLDGLGKLVVGGGLSAGEEADLDAGVLRAQSTLQSAASLALDGNTLRIVNLTGHKLPTGYGEGRRMWIRQEWRDGADAVLRVDGGEVALTVDIDGTPTPITTLGDLDATNTRIYEVHAGISQEWAAELLTLGRPGTLPMAFDRETGAVTATLGDVAAMAPGSVVETFHFVLNDTIASDNRIPPYEMRLADAAERNATPVPSTRYGDPQLPNGVYDHFDTLALNPPAGAASATIELLYESVSWEYASFLQRANTGAVTTLADTGDDLLDAWLNAPGSDPVVVATIEWAPPGAFENLGNALAGTNGPPSLVGTGTMEGGTLVTLTLSNALPGVGAWFLLGLTTINAPFKFGVMVPSPDIIIPNLPIDGGGQIVLPFLWPVGIPAGAQTFYQYWIQDPGGPVGWASSNGIVGTTP